MMSVDDSLKPGVDLRILAPQWGIGYPIIQRCFHLRGYACAVTSGNDSVHGAKSLHPHGLALDFRTKHVPMLDKSPLRDAITTALGAQWDVVLEQVGMEQEHIHVEFQPKDAEKSVQT
jgi:hypothetical protein